MTNRKHNFNPGPAALPSPVLEQLAADVIEFRGCGMSVLEISHRSAEYDGIQARAEQSLRRLLDIPEASKILFLGGGASLQFSMIPMNLRASDESADYLVSGVWAKEAFQEARRLGSTRIAASTEAESFRSLPRAFSVDPKAAYLHYTSNNTIYGTEWPTPPDAGAVPLVCDASSDILSRPLDMKRHALVYAGAQKNMGAAGVTVIILRDDLVARLAASKRSDLPAMLDYRNHIARASCYNTPPVFAVHAVSLVCAWLEAQGGLSAMAERNRKQAEQVYGVIDGNPLYQGVAEPASRSLMNLTFRLRRPELEGRFVAEAEARDLIGLKGHRSVGGLRASLYNAVPDASVAALCAFMLEFSRAHA